MRRSKRLPDSTDHFLTDVSGVIHIGSHLGQERGVYLANGLQVIWIEANPAMVSRLSDILQGWPDQSVFQALLSDSDGAIADFFLSNNDGASSSLFEAGRLQELWPNVNMIEKIELTTQRLDTFVAENQIHLADYPSLVMDIQGAELRVLQGAEVSLTQFQYVKLEAFDFEAYKGACLLDEIIDFMSSRGFHETARQRIAHSPDVGSAFDVTFRNSNLIQAPRRCA